jgi:hypothetical protein
MYGRASLDLLNRRFLLAAWASQEPSFPDAAVA